ncbi:hypothetical protein K9K77_01965 [Candidatus Babeliales bacterium]|nr:hypothetical protein [Candidatus Babeliales bacterium]
MMKKINKLVFLCLSAAMSTLSASIIDNRFIPWFARTTLRTIENRSFCKVDGFFVTANSAHGNESKEKKGIPEVYGDFDQKIFGQALETVGKTNYLTPAWQAARDVLWGAHGKLQGQGFDIHAEYALNKNFSMGMNWGWVHMTCNQKFVLLKETIRSLGLTTADEVTIETQRRNMFKELGFNDSEWSDSSMTDLVLYARLGGVRDYVMKFRSADFSFYCAGIIPVTKKRDINHPAAIPFGGDGLAGIMVGFDTHLEVKEDIWFSWSSRLSQRFAKIQNRRIPVLGEPEIFGATTGDMKVTPGVNLMFSPTLTFNDLQGGFGAQLQYVYSAHYGDMWSDERADKTIAIDISNIYAKGTKWFSEYLLFQLCYDFGKVSPARRRINPMVTFSWDIPIDFIGTEHRANTQRIGLGITFQF